MKNSLIIKKIIGMVVVALLLLTTKVGAAQDSFSTTINANSPTAKRGSNITITIGLKDIAITSGEKGIGAYTAGMEFDPSVLEYVESSGTDKWEAPFYEDGLITANTKDAKVVNTAGSIGTITFKVKDNAKLGETIVSLTNFSGSTVENDVPTSNVSVKIAIEDKVNDNNGNNNNGTGNNVNGIGNITNNNNKPSDNKNNTQLNTNKIPQAGENNGVLVAGIVSMIVASIGCFIKFRTM